MSSEDVPKWLLDKLRSTLKEKVSDFSDADFRKILQFIDEYTLSKEAFGTTIKFLLEERKFREIAVYMALLYHKELAEEGVREFVIANNVPEDTTKILRDYVTYSINQMKAKRGMGIGKQR